LGKSLLRTLFSRTPKAVAKSLLVIILFLAFSQMLTSLNQFFPRADVLIEIYVGVYVVFMFLSDLTKDTIYQHVLGMSKAFIFIGYTVYVLNNSIITQTIRSITFSVNLQVFLLMIILIGTLDFAKSLLQIINYIANKAETEEIIIPKLEQEIPAA
jgi:hypothetical protein